MSAMRRLAKWCVVRLLGTEARPRMIVRGLASGYTICVSPATNLGYLLGTAEPHLQQIIRDYVADGDTVYDIGANIGYVSLSLAKRVGLNGRVIAFEPLPRNADCFRQNIGNNRIRNVQLLEVAASDKCGDAVIRFGENLATASLVWHRDDPGSTELKIRTVVIDQLVEAGELGYPTFVKIDVEGSEGQVLQGMRHTIAAARPVVFIECSDKGRDISWPLLRALGYKCQAATTRERIGAFEDYRHADFLWLPGNSS